MKIFVFPIDRFHADVTKAGNAHARGRKKPVLSFRCIGGAASDKMTRSCCVVNCTNRSGNGIRMFNIPRKKHAFARNRRRLWLQAIKRADWGTDGPTGDESVCSAHFISGK